TTVSEHNNDYFELEKSVDAENWQVIGHVSGQGNSQRTTQYHFLDQFPFAGLQYYRLKQVDFDGSYTYSETILVEHPGTDTPVFQIFPNPVTANQIQIKALTFDKIIDLQVVDLQGKMINILVKKSERGKYLADLSQLPSGLYIAIIHTARGTYRSKLLKL
ncbi:MAG TPA: T9SS type A sorting domain-containing protein, partial [Flammeovirgaceae bacterium]|nr:T9SS type A sorting domain-containing protein [Flammeovirgaceae bacterium]